VTSLDDGTILDCNASFEKLTGYAQAEIIGKKSIATKFWVNGESQRLQHVALLKKDGFFKNLNISYINKNNEARQGIFSAEIVQLDNIACIITTMFDITELVETKEQLKESQNHYKILFDRSHDALFLVDTATGRYLEANHSAEILTGRSRKEIVTLTTKDITPINYKERLKKGQELAGSAWKSYECGDVSYIRPDGSKREAILTIVAGEGTHAFGIAKDVTDQRRTQKQLQQAQKMEAIGTLAGGIAHDFNNILGAILGYAEMIRDDCPNDSKIICDIDQVIKAANRAKDLVKQILAFSRQSESEKIPIQPAEIIEEAIKLLRPSIPTTITIQQVMAPHVGTILADPNQIHQVLMNLCTNAFHAMELQGGTLTLSLQEKVLTPEELGDNPLVQPGNYMQLSVRDTGTGIPPEIRKRIFDPYFTSKEIGKGTGMGLAMVHGIVQSCGGCITFESQLGEGTVFHVFLPLAEALASPVSLVPEHIPAGKEHILFIDDEDLLLEMGKSMLERLGYKVTARANGIEGLTTFQNQPEIFDLVITDQTMPGMTGIDLSRRILQIRPDMPIILCTGYSSLLSEEKVKAIGIKEFAMKPFTKKDIANLIRNVLKK
jgi:PAS domain S-box-containing protein